MQHNTRRSAVAWSGRRRVRLTGLVPLLVLAVLLGVAAYDSARQQEPVQAASVELHDELFSCSDAPSTPAEPLAWCADGSSPQCLPMAPPHANPDLWHGQPAAVHALRFSVPARNVITLPVHPALPEHALRTRALDPLERPPRV